MRVWNIFVMMGVMLLTLLIAGCEGSAEQRIDSSAYLKTMDVKGDSKSCAVVLRAQQGMTFTMDVTSEGDWAHFNNGSTQLNDTMTASDRVVYIYFGKNATGEARSAEVRVQFSDGVVVECSFTQHSYDSSLAFERQWAELPLCKVQNNYIYNTHYGALGAKSDARNYTYCFDPSVRASLWVAYPLHSSYMKGEGNRDYSEFCYDPCIDDELQAYMGKSYNGWYDRGHQIPAADRKCSQQMMDQTFYSTNMTPQQGNFNQGKWGVLEGRVRNMVCSDTLFVVTGAYFGGVHDSSIDSKTTDRMGNNCPTPTHYYKALLRTSKGNTGRSIDQISDAAQLKAIAFWFTHANTGSDTAIKSSDCISVAELEKRIGFELFPMIDDSIEEAVKSSAVPSMWGVNN
jgi:endonuclease G